MTPLSGPRRPALPLGIGPWRESRGGKANTRPVILPTRVNCAAGALAGLPGALGAGASFPCEFVWETATVNVEEREPLVIQQPARRPRLSAGRALDSCVPGRFWNVAGAPTPLRACARAVGLRGRWHRRSCSPGPLERQPRAAWRNWGLEATSDLEPCALQAALASISRLRSTSDGKIIGQSRCLGCGPLQF